MAYQTFTHQIWWVMVCYDLAHQIRCAKHTFSGLCDIPPMVCCSFGGHSTPQFLQCDGYRLEEIFNADETGLFFRALPSRSLTVKGDDCRGGKKSKDRISVLLACSAVGEKLTPFVIGHSARPRCFKGLASTLCLPVTYFSNKKAWMTGDLFQKT